MRHSPLFRLIAVVSALLGSLSAPALALAHGHVHEHVAQHHGGAHPSDHARSNGHHVGDHDGDSDEEHRDAAVTIDVARVSFVGSSSGGHQHGHPRLDVVPTGRELNRIPAAPPVVAMMPTPVSLRVTLLAVRVPLRTDRTLLARPDPDQGPPPALRAPPIG